MSKSINLVVDQDRLYLVSQNEAHADNQRAQLLKDLEYLKGFLVSVDKKLSNERFVQNAKPAVIDAERKKKADAESKIQAIEEALQSL